MRYGVKLLDSVLARLIANRNNGRRPDLYSAGLNHLPERTELLLPSGAGRIHMPTANDPAVAVAVADELSLLYEALGSRLAAVGTDAIRAVLAVGIGSAAGHIGGYATQDGKTEPLHVVDVVGPGFAKHSA